MNKTHRFLAHAILLVLVVSTSLSASAVDQEAGYEPPHTAAGKPDMSGIWQVLNTANYNVEAHPGAAAMIMREGPVVPVPAKEVVALGAIGAVPASLGVVEGDEIPYQIWALKKRDEKRRNWLQESPEIKCYLPGIPRATYMPYPFQIAHNDDALLFSYAYAGAVRNVFLSDPGEAPIDSWMGQSWARWEADTLVIETTGQHDQSWLDRSGNFHSELLKVTERFTRSSAHTINYEVTLEDETVYTRPWKMNMVLYKRVGADDRLMQFNCVEYVEEIMYGHLRKEPLE